MRFIREILAIVNNYAIYKNDQTDTRSVMIGITIPMKAKNTQIMRKTCTMTMRQKRGQYLQFKELDNDWTERGYTCNQYGS